MRPIGIRGPLLGFLLALAACGDDGGQSSSPSAAATVAYVVTSCRQTRTGMTVQQEVRILRDEAEAVTAVSVGPLGPFPSIACSGLGFGRRSGYPLLLGPVQRLGITPDGSGVVFELTDEFVQQGRGLLPPEQRGIYYVRADGSGVRRLGPASRSPAAYYGPEGYLFSFIDPLFAFDPNGQEFTYTDRGPDEAGHDAAQVFAQGLAPGAPSRQVTRLPALDFPGQFQFPENSWPWFIDARTIGFGRWMPLGTEYQILLVGVEGTPPREAPHVALPGGQVVQVFSIIGRDWIGAVFRLQGEPVNPNVGLPTITEAFAIEGTNVVQLTNFRRSDTSLQAPAYNARNHRVYFTASADPFGTNPTENCQLFSIDPLGRDLRQLTFFRESAAHATNGCVGGRRPDGCRIDLKWSGHPSLNPQTGTIFFHSSCDPFGRNPNGQQVFAMQPDGSDLRQLTNARGFVQGAGGIVDVEIVDTFVLAPYQ